MASRTRSERLCSTRREKAKATRAKARITGSAAGLEDMTTVEAEVMEATTVSEVVEATKDARTIAEAVVAMQARPTTPWRLR